MSNDRNVLESQLRSYLRKLARGRKSKSVNADDVHTFLNKKNVSLSPSETTSLTRTVLTEPDFYQAGHVTSQRVAAKGRNIVEWRLATAQPTGRKHSGNIFYGW